MADELVDLVSARQASVLLPTDSAVAGAKLSLSLRDAIPRHRSEVLGALGKIPAFVDLVGKVATDGQRYRVLISGQNAHLFRKNIDGVWKTALKGADGRFVENVDLVRVPPDVAGALAIIAVQAALTEISAKLDLIIVGVQDLANLVRLANHGGLKGAIDALDVARHIKDDGERRTQVLMACQHTIVNLGAVAGQMAANIQRMPSEMTRFGDGWRKGEMAKVEAAYRLVRDDFAVLGDGLRRVVSAYVELGEHSAACEAFALVCDRVTDANLQMAADRARLLPYPMGGPGPERVFEAFLKNRPAIAARLNALAKSQQIPLALDLEIQV